VTESRDPDAVPEFRNDSPRWTDWGWPEQTPTDPNAIARYLAENEPEPHGFIVVPSGRDSCQECGRHRLHPAHDQEDDQL
jgi:hypothetical protein